MIEVDRGNSCLTSILILSSSEGAQAWATSKEVPTVPIKKIE
jgi:hypothetical protein